eukprot:UN14411
MLLTLTTPRIRFLEMLLKDFNGTFLRKNSPSGKFFFYSQIVLLPFLHLTAPIFPRAPHD